MSTPSPKLDRRRRRRMKRPTRAQREATAASRREAAAKAHLREAHGTLEALHRIRGRLHVTRAGREKLERYGIPTEIIERSE